MLTGMLGPPELLVCLTLNARDATKRCQVGGKWCKNEIQLCFYQRFESMKDFHSFSKEGNHKQLLIDRFNFSPS